MNTSISQQQQITDGFLENTEINDQSELSIQCELVPKINFACHQNSFSLIRDFQVINHNPHTSKDEISIILESNPAFIKPKIWRFERLAPNSNALIRDKDLQLDAEFLLNLTDSINGSINIRAESQGKILTQTTKHVELLAHNEWGGSGYMPELLAAFISPNDPVIDRILKEASELLRKARKNDKIDGYQSGSRQRVWEIVSSIYSAIANLKLSYAEPPASFEKDGQKIRLPSRIVEGGVATCLDTALLFAAACEQAGLNPIVALSKGHALAGVWLQPTEFSTIVINEAETLRKRIEIDELILIETTYVTSYPSPSFSQSLKAAKDTISLEKDSNFIAAIDVKKARSHQIKPLGLTATSSVVDSTESIKIDYKHLLEEAPSLPDFDLKLEEEPINETPEGRLERWQRRLLDLTLTNNLLNHRAVKGSLKIVCPDPAMLEDKLAAGKKISISPVPKPIGAGQDENLHRQRTGDVISEEYARNAIQKDQVLVDLDEEELSKRLVDIYRKTQTALQEGGANILYLALGFLLWKRGDDDRRFKAPLILVPVSLERKSVRSGIKIVAHEDEPKFNTTLLEMLRKDFSINISGLEDLPKDESGIDVPTIWNKVRLAIKEVSGFEVVEDTVLGHFSFAKYLMWKDLVDRIDQLKENPVVSHLIDNPREPYPSSIDINPRELDKLYKPSDLFIPLPADSSQIAAIAAADSGKDFVIFGPPGTGKSQTIANMIVHLLGKGKTVLFVSEKIAALEVVYRRLHDVGLSEFCLQLHSNKARKQEVLGQLRNAWNRVTQKTEQQWDEQAVQLEALRDNLNKFVAHLHKKHSNGLTPYEAMGRKIKDESLASSVVFSWTRADQYNEQTLKKMRQTVEKLAIQAHAIENIHHSPFDLISSGDWTPIWEENIVSNALSLSKAARKALISFNSFCEVIGITISNATLAKLDSLALLAELLQQSYKRPGAYALEADGAERIELLEEAVVKLRSYAHALTKLSCEYEPEAWRKLDAEEILHNWQAANQTWWPKQFFAKHKIIKHMKANGAIGNPDPAQDAPILAILRQEGYAIDTLDQKLSDLRIWQKHLTEVDKVENLKNLVQHVRETSAQLADNAQSLGQLRQSIRTLINEGNDLLAPDATVGCACETYLLSFKEFKQACTSFERDAGQEIRNNFLETNNALEVIQNTAEKIISSCSGLRDWCAWRRARSEALNLDLKPLIDALESGLIDLKIPLVDVFESAYCNWWSKAVITEDEVLRSFSTPEHISLIDKFKELDDKFQETTANYVITKLRSAPPSQHKTNKGEEWGILQRELQKQRQHKPIRQLMQNIPSVITRLTPCLMMSPLSIAQYLPTGQDLFDVVIFDEASQITVWDAVGAISRGKQVIVAGDPRQMPPSNRFGRADDDDAQEDEQDLESILDEMLGANIPPYKLNWHYRSKKESLIAFSNHRYYESKLITFPAPSVIDQGVKLVPVTGVYTRGAGRQNEIEARKVVQECVRRLKHHDKQISSQSIGIVTFNIEQQSLIENLLDAERAADPSIESAFSKENMVEPVFVKNLDTVQGDERDVILFSITFGPDQSGHITMHFGDLNKQGGGRRLNVALTRARSEMIVFSSLPYEQIDLSRTQASAVKDLKHFLEYAKKGPSILGALISGPQGDFESPFEMAVAEMLREKGWQVSPQIGVSAYRIDLGIVNPDKPGCYIAGVECDGATYHSSATARDRDKIREVVLKQLGWNLIRIWSTDWWNNKHKALKVLDEKLKKLLEEDRSKGPDKDYSEILK